ncbi:hypothetical protein M758_7G034500, partial [Ceratodon purpureus]
LLFSSFVSYTSHTKGVHNKELEVPYFCDLSLLASWPGELVVLGSHLGRCQAVTTISLDFRVHTQLNVLTLRDCQCCSQMYNLLPAFVNLILTTSWKIKRSSRLTVEMYW